MNNERPMPQPLQKSLICGLKGVCPNCGTGKIFKSYLKISDCCPHCREELHHHRADDLPAYYVVLITGHIVVTLACAVELKYSPPYWVHFILWFPITLCMVLGLLQPIKGAIAALQWHLGMHGFKHAKQLRDTSK